MFDEVFSEGLRTAGIAPNTGVATDARQIAYACYLAGRLFESQLNGFNSQGFTTVGMSDPPIPVPAYNEA